MNDWQSWVSGGIVAIVLIAFASQLFRPRRRKSGSSCGHSCGCNHHHQPAPKAPSSKTSDSSSHSHH